MSKHTVLPRSLDKDLLELQTVFEEPVLGFAIFPCLLLQIANPGVSRAVVTHSRVFRQPLARLRETLTWIYIMFFGTSEEKETIARVVDNAHGRVKGPGYDANDPELQMWLAACIYACNISVYEEVLGPFDDDAAADRLYHQAFYHAAYLRVPREMLPVDRQAFWVYWNKQIEQLEVTNDAKALSMFALSGQTTPFWTWPALRMAEVIAAELLPPRIRDAYYLKRRSFVFNVVFQTTKYVYPLIPRIIRRFSVHIVGYHLRKYWKGTLSK